jgi:tetratricopeptide (TPR) repeat protein
MQALASLDRAGDELRAALQWAVATDHGDHLGLRLSSALGRSWYLRGRIHEGASWLERALAADQAAPRELRATALHWLGVMLDEQRDGAGAISRLEEALQIQREIADQGSIARELNSLGVAHRNIGDYQAAEALLTEGLMLRRLQNDTAGVATVLTNLGILAIDRGDLNQAIEVLDEALGIDRKSGATGGAAYSSSALGTALLRIGRQEDAIDLLASALSAFDDLHDMDGVAETLERLGEAALVDEPLRAARLLMAARSIRERERIALRGIDEARASQLFANLRTALTMDELQSAQADADAMDADDAVAFALAGRER